jgi:hypothetical protein
VEDFDGFDVLAFEQASECRQRAAAVPCKRAGGWLQERRGPTTLTVF